MSCFETLPLDEKRSFWHLGPWGESCQANSSCHKTPSRNSKRKAGSSQNAFMEMIADAQGLAHRAGSRLHWTATAVEFCPSLGGLCYLISWEKKLCMASSGHCLPKEQVSDGNAGGVSGSPASLCQYLKATAQQYRGCFLPS